MAFCINCGKEVNDGAKFCTGCGTPTGVAAGGQSPVAYQQVKSAGVTPPPTVDDFDDIEKKSPNYTIVIIAAVAVCVAAIIGIVVMKSGTAADEETSSAAASNTDSVQGDIPAPTQQNTAYSTFTDSRDGKKYKIIKVGTQTWMAENLNYAAKGSVCYENDAANCVKYGRLYDWKTATKACPAGFHLPDNAEWKELEDYAGGYQTAGEKLKSKNGWNDNRNGTDEYGFFALPSGYSNFGSFSYAGDNGYWWSATEGEAYSIYLMVDYYYEDVNRYGSYKNYQLSVRCVQDN